MAAKVARAVVVTAVMGAWVTGITAAATGAMTAAAAVAVTVSPEKVE